MVWDPSKMESPDFVQHSRQRPVSVASMVRCLSGAADTVPPHTPLRSRRVAQNSPLTLAFSSDSANRKRKRRHFPFAPAPALAKSPATRRSARLMSSEQLQEVISLISAAPDAVDDDSDGEFPEEILHYVESIEGKPVCLSSNHQRKKKKEEEEEEEEDRQTERKRRRRN